MSEESKVHQSLKQRNEKFMQNSPHIGLVKRFRTQSLRLNSNVLFSTVQN